MRKDDHIICCESTIEKDEVFDSLEVPLNCLLNDENINQELKISYVKRLIQNKRELIVTQR